MYINLWNFIYTHVYIYIYMCKFNFCMCIYLLMSAWVIYLQSHWAVAACHSIPLWALLGPPRRLQLGVRLWEELPVHAPGNVGNNIILKDVTLQIVSGRGNPCINPHIVFNTF